MAHIVEYSINEINVSGKHKLVDGKTVGDRAFVISPLAFIINEHVYTIQIIIYTTSKRSLETLDDCVALVGMVSGRKVYICPEVNKYNPRAIGFEYTITGVPKDATKEDLDNILGEQVTTFIEDLDTIIEKMSKEVETVGEEDNMLTFTKNLINK